jgi:hypothetical protein
MPRPIESNLKTAVFAILAAATGAIAFGGQDLTDVGLVDGRDIAADGTKLDGIEAGADDVDFAAVNAALATADATVDFNAQALSGLTVLIGDGLADLELYGGPGLAGAGGDTIIRGGSGATPGELQLGGGAMSGGSAGGDVEVFGSNGNGAEAGSISLWSGDDISVGNARGGISISTGAQVAPVSNDILFTSHDAIVFSAVSVDLGTDMVQASEIEASAVGTSEVDDNTLTASDLAADSCAASEIAASAVGTSEVDDNTLTASDLAADACGTSEIASGAVLTDEIGADTIALGDVADSAVHSATYTPTVTCTSLCGTTAETVAGDGKYVRIGNVLIVSDQFTVAASGAGSVAYRWDLPVASDLAVSSDCVGALTSTNSTFLGGRCEGDTTNNQISCVGRVSASTSHTEHAVVVCEVL